MIVKFTSGVNFITFYDMSSFLIPGVNFINILRAAFMGADPKSAKKTVKSSSFLHFWDLRA